MRSAVGSSWITNNKCTIRKAIKKIALRLMSIHEERRRKKLFTFSHARFCSQMKNPSSKNWSQHKEPIFLGILLRNRNCIYERRGDAIKRRVYCVFMNHKYQHCLTQRENKQSAWWWGRTEVIAHDDITCYTLAPLIQAILKITRQTMIWILPALSCAIWHNSTK